MSEPTPLQLPPHSVVLLGAFNPAIVHPAWMQTWVPSLRETTVETLIPARPDAPTFHATTDRRICWWASSDRFVVHGPADVTGEIAAAVLEQLPHTPLRAAGVNFQFETRVSRERMLPWRTETAVEHMTKTMGAAPSETMVSQTVTRNDGVRLTLRVSWPRPETDALIDLNYHRDAREPEGQSRANELAAHVRRTPDLECDANRIRRELMDE